MVYDYLYVEVVAEAWFLFLYFSSNSLPIFVILWLVVGNDKMKSNAHY